MDGLPVIPPSGLQTDALEAFELYRGAKFEVVQRCLEDVFAYPGSVVPITSASDSGPSVLQAVKLTHMTLAVIRFGTETRTVTGPMDAYHVTLALSGDLLCYFGAHKITVRPGLAAVNPPDAPSLIPHWSPNSEILCIKIRPSSLQDELATMIGRPVRSPVHLGIDFDLTSPVGQGWLSILRLMLLELATSDSLARTSKGHREQLERLLISALLRAQPHELSPEVWRERTPDRWRPVKRVVEAIEANPEHAWTLAQFADIAGVSGRRLQQLFNAQLDLSPMAYLQSVRLDRVHQELLADAGHVSDLSMRWGFTHLGRFAAAYRARYGESPSETRRRAQTILV